MVGARRPGAGPLGLRLCAGEPPRRFPGLSRSLRATQRRTARALLSRAGGGIEVRRGARGAAHRNPEPGSHEPHLLRAGLSRPLSRLSAGGGRRSRHARRPDLRPDDRRPQALRRPLEACRRRLVRPARTELVLAHRRSRSARGHSAGRRRGRKHARRRHGRIARHARLPARARPAAARRGSAHAEHRDLVVRPAARARAGPRRIRPDFDRLGVRRRASGVAGADQRHRGRAHAERTRAPARLDRRARAGLRRAGSRAPLDDAALDGRQARAAPVRPARLLRRRPATAGG